jgi:hypothetical protein
VIGHGQCRRLAAAVVLASSVRADLRALRCVDAVQVDTRASNLQGVAVDHRSPADDWGGQDGRGKERDEAEGPGTRSNVLSRSRYFDWHRDVSLGEALRGLN